VPGRGGDVDGTAGACLARLLTYPLNPKVSVRKASQNGIACPALGQHREAYQKWGRLGLAP